ncbi:MAG: hypothetical protein IT432_13545 [Phycisphaerales bacterium]|nr:hypothetical protein [Phycisphaerales bacterium]
MPMGSGASRWGVVGRTMSGSSAAAAAAGRWMVEATGVVAPALGIAEWAIE